MACDISPVAMFIISLTLKHDIDLKFHFHILLQLVSKLCMNIFLNEKQFTKMLFDWQFTVIFFITASSKIRTGSLKDEFSVIHKSEIFVYIKVTPLMTLRAA